MARAGPAGAYFGSGPGGRLIDLRLAPLGVPGGIRRRRGGGHAARTRRLASVDIV